MKRTYAMRRLLEHGPLKLREAVDITGWPYRATQVALRDLIEDGAVIAHPAGETRHLARVYALADHARACAHFGEGAGA